MRHKAAKVTDIIISAGQHVHRKLFVGSQISFTILIWNKHDI